MKSSFLTLLLGVLISIPLVAQEKLNVSLFGQFDRGDTRYSGSWSYVNLQTRQEYALLGTKNGVAVYSIDTQPISEISFIPGPASNWREITVLGDYAYVTTEGTGQGEGMQIINLSTLPDSAHLVNTYSATFTRGHIIQRDMYSDLSYVYVMGTCSTCGVHILDVSHPENPREVSTYSPGYYVHDAHIRGDYLYAAAFYEGVIDIVDISNKFNPTLVAQIEVPGGNTHSAWTTEDVRHLIISSEKDGLPARIWNIEDLDNLYEVATFTGNEVSLTHNPYVRGNFVFFSHNTEGLRVVDIKDSSLPVEVGFYDTFDGASGGFSGLWSACPYYPSNKIIGGNREDGLYVWTFNNTRAGRFYTKIKDAKNGMLLKNAEIYIHKMDVFLKPDLEGLYKFGALPGKFRLEITADGYETQTTEVRLEPGDSLNFEISLEPTSVGLLDPFKKVPSLELYPNPFVDVAQLNIEGFEKPKHLKIYNSLGHLIHLEKINGTQTHLLKRNEKMQKGIFFLALYNDQKEMLANKRVFVK